MFQRIRADNRVPTLRILSANDNQDIQLFPSVFPANFECLRHCSRNHASLPHPTIQSGDFHSLRPIHIRPH
ncbi:hypothetical protein TNCV_2578721 [Trichonephila clavipes]|nr:hypothetical protein TNCV_2578721 [Trichonephila clavipes]